MVQHKKQIKLARSAHSHRAEQTEIFDDNLLPEASEIQKLHTLDPEILSWLKVRAEQEQEFRHQVYNRRSQFFEDDNKRSFLSSMYALTIYLVLVSGCGFASFVLVREAHNTQGSIFGGAAVILALAVLVARKPKKQFEKDQ